MGSTGDPSVSTSYNQSNNVPNTLHRSASQPVNLHPVTTDQSSASSISVNINSSFNNTTTGVAALTSPPLGVAHSEIISTHSVDTNVSPTKSIQSTFRPPVASKPPAIPYFALDEIARHNKEDDFWTIVNSRVYDLTDYLKLHPGGARLLLKNGGLDSTDDFVALHHSRKAVAILDAYWIGDIVGSRHRSPPLQAGSALTDKRKSMLGDALKVAASVPVATRRSQNFLQRSLLSVSSATLAPNNSLQSKVPAAAKSLVSNTAFSISLTPPVSMPVVPVRTASPPAVQKPRLFTITKNESISKDTRLIELQLVTQSNSSNDYLTQSLSQIRSGHITIHWNNESGEVIKRQYTPIACTATTITLMVKVYQHKSSTTQLFHHELLPLASTLPVHGPYTSFNRSIDHLTDIVMICHGSGITPMYQIMFHISSTRGRQRVWLLYGARTIDDIWLREEIASMSDSRKSIGDPAFTLQFQISSLHEKSTDPLVHPGRISDEIVEQFIPHELSSSAAYLICGTDLFAENSSSLLKRLHIDDKLIHIF